jgi:DNA-binding transcriptional LysR family regulator
MEMAFVICYVNTMELRHIRYFLAVAEEGNFTRAAAKLGIGQPPLSIQIRDLEAEVGTQLFHRLSYGAELTEAGQAFWDAVHTMPAQANTAIRAAQRASRGETGRLRLGFTGTAALSPIVSATIRAFHRNYPEVELTLEEANSVALTAGLIEGRLDAAILRPNSADPPEIREYLLKREPLVAVLPVAHPAVTAGSDVELASLSTIPLIVTPREIGVSLHEAAIAACRSAGFEPLLGQFAPQIASILSLVSAELGFSLVPASMAQFNVVGVAFLTLRNEQPTVDLAVAHLKTRPSQSALNFTRVARSLKSGDGEGLS